MQSLVLSTPRFLAQALSYEALPAITLAGAIAGLLCFAQFVFGKHCGKQDELVYMNALVCKWGSLARPSWYNSCPANLHESHHIFGHSARLLVQ